MDNFTHFDSQGNAVMVDVSDKTETKRVATAVGKIKMSKDSYDKVKTGDMKKGDVLSVARIAGIMATKNTPQLIPLCHTILIEKSVIDFEMIDEKDEIKCICTVACRGVTGVEMEALTGVSVALLTIYDMCKAVDKFMEIKEIYLEEKLGGKSGSIKNPRSE